MRREAAYNHRGVLSWSGEAGVRMADGDFPRPTVVVVATLVWGALLLPGLLGAALSVMFFDAPGSMNNPAAWANALIVASFPLLCIVSIAASWIVWARRKNRIGRFLVGTQLAVACLPLLPIAYIAGAMVIGTIGVLVSGQPLGLHSTIIKH
jgi:hypothetical protein